jgi:hypothetical protein
MTWDGEVCLRAKHQASSILSIYPLQHLLALIAGDHQAAMLLSTHLHLLITIAAITLCCWHPSHPVDLQTPVEQLQMPFIVWRITVAASPWSSKQLTVAAAPSMPALASSVCTRSCTWTG